MAFVKAQKYNSFLRLSIAGPSGSGKTYTSLKLATALADGKGIAVIDTERGSASKYSDEFAFDVMELDTFHPEQFIEGIHDAERGGYAVLVIDSLSHAWNGTGGLLEIVDGIARRKYSGNTFAAWKDATPVQNALVDAITRSKLHIIVTMRSKQEYAVEKDERTGKTAPKKIGMAPVQREGMEYEFDIAVDMDIDNSMIVQKSRCSALSGQIISKPDSKVADILKAWLRGSGEAPTKPRLITKEQFNALYDKGKERNLWQTASAMYAYFSVQGVSISKETALQLTVDEYEKLDALVEQEEAALVR